MRSSKRPVVSTVFGLIISFIVFVQVWVFATEFVVNSLGIVGLSGFLLVSVTVSVCCDVIALRRHASRR